MTAYGFTPDRNYLYKKFAQILLITSIVMGVTTLLGSQIGYWFNPSRGGIWGVVIGLSINLVCVGLITVLIYQHYCGLFYEIHEDEVVMHVGVITRSVTHVPFLMITNLKLRRSPFDRIFKLGTIDIQTAGHTEHHGATESLLGLRNYKEIYDRLAASIRQNHGSTFSTREKGMVSSCESEMLRILLREMKSIRILLENHELH
jgi:membrane protein YdbS with pleckstrin-like domain